MSETPKAPPTWKDWLWNWYHHLIWLLCCTQTHLIWAEAHIAELQDGGQDGPYGGDLISLQLDGLKAFNKKLEVLFVLLPPQLTGTTLQDVHNRWSNEGNRSRRPEVVVMVMYLVQVIIGFSSLQVQFPFVPVVQTCQQLIKHVIVPFFIGLKINIANVFWRLNRPDNWGTVHNHSCSGLSVEGSKGCPVSPELTITGMTDEAPSL